MEMRALDLGLGMIDVVLRPQPRIGFHLRLIEMKFSIFHSLFVNPRELPDLQNIKIALRDFEDQFQIDELLLCNLAQVRPLGLRRYRVRRNATKSCFSSAVSLSPSTRLKNSTVSSSVSKRSSCR